MSDAESTASLSDRLSITALVVSLIALLIGISSFIQAILGTAEGYRRCADVVIGPWSKLRRRVWRWSEFRYETRFRAPLIKLITNPEFAAKQYNEDAGNIFPLNQKQGDLIERPPRTWSDYVFRRYDPADVLVESLHQSRFQVLQEQRHAGSFAACTIAHDALGDTWNTQALVETFKTQGLRRSSTQIQWMKKQTARSRDTMLVSWLRLMHELHVLYGSYWPMEKCEACVEKSVETFHSELAASLSRKDVLEFYGKQWDASRRTKIAIVVLEWTWDFMPSDVARPLAYSTIGDVIIFALRLGMVWRSLDKARNQFSADGNGRSITSADVKGLGLVSRFNTSSQPDYTWLDTIIPSRGADKMMCGIIPGDADLVGLDFPLINGERKLINLWERGGLYSQLGLDDAFLKRAEKQNRWTTHNEVVTLLCSWLPLPGSKLTGILFPGWKSRQYSIFHFFEPRLKLLTSLRERDRTASMQTVLGTLETLASKYKYFFYASYVEEKPEDIKMRRLELTEFCAKAFRETTRYFISEGYNEKPDKIDATWYMQLIAAHTRLSVMVNEKTDYSRATSRAGIPADIVELMKTEGIKSSYFASHLWNQTQLYIDGVDDGDYGVVDYVQHRAFKEDAASIRDAWWMLMLRGILWDLSNDDHVYPGEPVISALYGDESPVWFT